MNRINAYSERQEILKISKRHLDKKTRSKLLAKCHDKWATRKEMKAIPFKYGLVGVYFDDDDDYDYQ